MRTVTAHWASILQLGLIFGGLLAGCAAPAQAEVPVTIITATPSQTAPATATALMPATPTFEPFPTSTATFTPTPTPVCPESKGTVTKEQLASQALDGQKIPFNLYLPPCYDVYTWQRYPVLYLIHGVNMNEDTWVEVGAAETADDLLGQGAIPPFIIVMPRAPDDDRFTETVVFDLVPYIDEHYRTLPDRYYRALGGMSRGGGWTVRIGLQYPHLFGSLGLHSLAIMFADEDKVVGWLNRLPDEKLPRIYLDIGQSDSLLESASWLDEALTARFVAHEWHLNPGRHEIQYWRTHLPEYLRWYSATW
jgi:enterochelin esterase-like enzyme